MHKAIIKYSLIILVLIFSGIAKAATITTTLGEQDFVDGYTPILATEYANAGLGEVAPFDGSIFGSDGNIFSDGELGSFSYTITFASTLNILSAELVIGLIDHDSYTTDDDTIDIFFNGVWQDDSLFKGISNAPSSVSVVTLPVDVALLTEGSLEVYIEATQSVPDYYGNGIAADFSQLNMVTAVPVPAAIWLFGSALLALTGFRRRSI